MVLKQRPNGVGPVKLDHLAHDLVPNLPKVDSLKTTRLEPSKMSTRTGSQDIITVQGGLRTTRPNNRNAQTVKKEDKSATSHLQVTNSATQVHLSPNGPHEILDATLDSQIQEHH